MATTQDDIRGWLMRGKRDGATHVIIATDTFGWTDYPVYVQPDEDVTTRLARVQGQDMIKVMEVYNLALPLEAQLAEYTAWHL